MSGARTAPRVEQWTKKEFLYLITFLKGLDGRCFRVREATAMIAKRVWEKADARIKPASLPFVLQAIPPHSNTAVIITKCMRRN